MRPAQYQCPSKKESYSLKGAPDGKDRTNICIYSSIVRNEKNPKNPNKKTPLQTIYIFINRDE